MQNPLFVPDHTGLFFHPEYYSLRKSVFFFQHPLGGDERRRQIDGAGIPRGFALLLHLAAVQTDPGKADSCPYFIAWERKQLVFSVGPFAADGIGSRQLSWEKDTGGEHAVG